MSATLEKRTRPTRPFQVTDRIEETEPGVERDSLDFIGIGSEPETLEEAIREEEGPETRQESKAEAPDAGRGETLSIEREFTHGRSRS